MKHTVLTFPNRADAEAMTPNVSSKFAHKKLSLWIPEKLNVDYTKKTPGRPLHNAKLGIYHSKPLSSGNAKLDPSILIFDMLAVNTCLNCSSCAPTCYALKAQRQYPGTFNKRAINTWMARHDLRTLESHIMNQLERTNKRTVRIHSSGDFISREYVNMWERLAVCFDHITFYFYTKIVDRFGTGELNEVRNVNMVRSVLPDGERNYGDMFHVTAMAAKYGAAICPYGIDSMEPVKCGTECRVCMNHEFVLFKQH